MTKQKKTFNTQGPINSELHYSVPRTDAVADLVRRIKDGRYVVIFAPRQTGKTTLFQQALEMISDEEPDYFPLQLDFQMFKNASTEVFYSMIKSDIREEIDKQLQRRNLTLKTRIRRIFGRVSFDQSLLF